MPPNSSAGSARPKSRRSFAQMPHRSMGSGIDKENMTADMSAMDVQQNVPDQTKRDKKLRSKSLGPGGLDALQKGTGNRRKSTVQFPLKSILKPTVPVSPVRPIPAFEETRKRTPARSPRRSPRGHKNGQSDLLIDFSTPPSAPVVGTDNLANPFDSFNPSSIMRQGRAGSTAEEGQRATAREKEEQQRLERERQAILDQREARRKSMANRRVSFAPEATLHTWNVVELAEDSTTSSASNSTRRASSMPTDQTGQPGDDEAEETVRPSTQQLGGHTQNHQHDAHTDKPRGTTGISPTSIDNPDDAEAFSSSPFSGSSAGGGEDTGPASVDENGPSGSDTDDADSTAMSMDDGTERTVEYAHSDTSSTDSSARLDRSLRHAAEMAGTRGIEYDEHEDLSMEFTNHEIAGAFQPWIKKDANREDFDLEDLSSRQDQENINPFEQRDQYQANNTQPQSEYGDDGDLSMDVTNAIGGILTRQNKTPSPGRYREASLRQSVGGRTDVGDQTMEFTNVVGGIAQNATPSPPKEQYADSEIADDEEMTMEFTSVFDGLVNKAQTQQEPQRHYFSSPEHLSSEVHGYAESLEFEPEELEMDMTNAIGGILPPIQEQTEPEDNETMGMEMTNAMGEILSPFGASNRAQGKALMELETDAGQLASSPFQENIVPSPPKVAQHMAAVASESGSPSLASVQRRSGRRSTGSRASPTPNSSPRRSTPRKGLSTPSKTGTPQAARPTTPSKTPPSSNITFRSASPKKLFKPEIRQRSAHKSPSTPRLFQHDSQTGQTTPSFILRPNRRSSSGLGIDKEGLGSPRVAEILDRRRSIGEESQEFVPQQQTSRGVRFDDPREIAEEVEREEEGRTETPLLDESTENTTEKEATLNLREMISSLTPKKNKLKGRKSLHVGTAVGLLGKRPKELDEEEDEEEEYTPKRLKGREASPVKNVRLPAPPSKAETVGHTRRSTSQHGFGSSPLRQNSPQKGNRRMTIAEFSTSEKSSTQDTTDITGTSEQPSTEVSSHDAQPIQLNEFLEMTNIHFMELTTTKRRHTLAPKSSDKRTSRSSVEGTAKEITLEDCVAAGFCTVPMLELYQHSCRELKSYISEGRQIIRSIEVETYADNPPLFHEYVTAPPDIRLLMDNQFRNVKTHARLLSKSMWYEWRMKLLEGLKEGLDRHIEEMRRDEVNLAGKEKLLDGVVPALVDRRGKLEVEARELEKVAEEMENCDQEELHKTHERLAAVDAEIAEKRRLLEEGQSELRDKSNVVEAGAQLKGEFLQQIREAEHIQEKCRGWGVKEVQTLKGAVHKLEKQTKWSILAIASDQASKFGPSLSMRYRDELQLDFHPGTFNVKRTASARRSPQPSENGPIKLSYSPVKPEPPGSSKTASPPEKSLTLHALRSSISQISQASITPQDFLSSLSVAWDKAIYLSKEIRMLGYCGITRATSVGPKREEPSLVKVRCMLLGQVKLPPAKADTNHPHGDKTRARVDVDFTVKARFGTTALDVDMDVDVSASHVYGFASSGGRFAQRTENQMSELLNKALLQNQKNGSGVELGDGLWRNAVVRLERDVFG